jgi:hypothetical protein
MNRQFIKGEKVKTTRPPGFIDATDTQGIVEGHSDWWVMVRMSKSGIVYPFMEGELEHARSSLD